MDAAKVAAGKRERPAAAGLSKERLPNSMVMMKSYLFFEDFLLDFFAAFFFVAINTHHLSCRTGPPGRAYLAKSAGSLRQTC
jgi:hypothetical protein